MSKRIAVLAFLVAACAGNPAPFQIDVAPADHAQLEGRWVGSFDNERTGRYGTIVFALQASADTAFGEVFMPLAQDQWVGDRNRQDKPLLATVFEPPAVLTIQLVRVRGNQVAGILDPYVSPDCDCVVVTIFAGLIDGDVIRGTFVTEGQAARVAEGVWHVARAK